MERLVLDTYAWIEYFTGSSKGLRVKELLLEAEAAYTPSIVLAELARKYLREGVDEDVVRDRLHRVARLSEVVPIDVSVSLEAGKAYMELREHARKLGLGKPSLNDAIVLATARIKGARVVTGDEHFKGLPETIWLGDT